MNTRKTTIEGIKAIATRLLGVAILAGAVVLLVGPGASQSQTSGGLIAAGAPRRVTVDAVRAALAARPVRFHGVVRAKDRATLAFPAGGRLLERRVNVADRVREGEVLARIDTRARADQAASFAATADELDARIVQARRDRERAEHLHSLGAASRAQLEAARAQEDALVASHRATRARVREARRGHGDGVLRAPFDGVVTDVLLEPGEMASPGAPVIVLSGSDGLEVEVQVPESIVASLETERAAEVDLPLAGRDAIAARITSVGRTAGPSQLFPVVVAIDGGDGLIPGMTAEVVLQTAADAALSVPVRAVVNPAGRSPTVFVVRDGTAVREPIEVGELLGERVTVTGALEDGDDVVVGGLAFLLDGDAVEVVR